MILTYHFAVINLSMNFWHARIIKAVRKHPKYGKDSLLLTRPATKSILTRLSDISLRNLFPIKSNLSCQGHSNNPLNIELEITLRCNSKCPQCSRHCNIISYGNSEENVASGK